LITRIQELSSNSVAPHFGLPGKQILVSQGFAVGTSPGSVEEKPKKSPLSRAFTGDRGPA